MARGKAPISTGLEHSLEYLCLKLDRTVNLSLGLLFH